MTEEAYAVDPLASMQAIQNDEYGGNAMLIQIMRDKNHYDYVKESQLDKLIALKLIEKFKRISGWVTLGVDPVRDTSKTRNKSKKSTPETP